MFPRYFPYGQLPAVPNMNILLGLNLGLPVDATSVASAQDISSLLLSAQPSLPGASAVPAASPYFLPQASHFLSGLPITNAVNPLMAQLNLSQMLPILNPSLLQQPVCGATPTSESTDPHTIVRAPVLYGNVHGNAASQVQMFSSILVSGLICA